MSEISYYDMDLGEAIEAIKGILAKLVSSGSNKQEKFLLFEKKMKEIGDLKRGYTLSMRQLTNKEDLQFYREKLSKYNEKLEELQEEYKGIKSEADRNGVIRGIRGGKNLNEMNNGELLNEALKVQDKTEQSLVRSAQLVAQSKEVGMATASQLDDQRRRIVSLTDDVMRIDSALTRADKLIRTFGRRMMTDRVILCFATLIFAGIAGIIVYTAINPNQKTFHVPDVITPPNPKTLNLTRLLREIN